MKRNTFRIWLERIFSGLGLGMRAKLIMLFVVIKVVPLVLLAYLAWTQSLKLGNHMELHSSAMAQRALRALADTGAIAVSDAVKALDARATDDIERMTTEAAQRAADFLYARDGDVLLAASLDQKEEVYRAFIQNLRSRLVKPGKWALAPDGKSWQRVDAPLPAPDAVSTSPENEHGFHYRAPDNFEYELRPLYREMSFIDLDGMERVKAVSSPDIDPALKDVSQRRNTFIGAETYFRELAFLKPGEIYVSDVIGEYVGSKVIGAYTPDTAAKAGIEFDPENSAYAGVENPVGKRFRGIVRWATPVVKDGRITGYVTLALDHDHLMELMAHITPTEGRYQELPDASEGNYAFIWDHKGRSIVHPRHFSIAGYDAGTGEPQVPWLEDDIYRRWQASGKDYADFIVDEPTFVEQSINKKPARELTRQGLVGLDCRYLNFAPQCTGWFDLTRNGGSGSFLILWSGLWKLTTAAVIPYYTGQYGYSMRGFGFVTIGAGLSDFHRPATETGKVINELVNSTDQALDKISSEATESITRNLYETATRLIYSTAGMSALVILIAIWMASLFTGSITRLISGVERFRAGERDFRFHDPVKDEIGALADSIDDMADSLVASRQEPEIITDLSLKILYANEHALALLGKNMDEVAGQPYKDNAILPYGSEYCPITALVKGTDAQVMLYSEGRHFQGKASYLRDKKGGHIGYMVTISDVSAILEEQKKNEQQRMLLATVFSAIPDMIWYEDEKGRCLAVNPRLASLVGVAPEDIRGKVLEELVPDEIRVCFRDFRGQAIATGMPLHTEEFVTFADGHQETVDVVRTPLFNFHGDYVGLLGVARDVSQRVVVESQLRRTQQELEKAVQEANKASEFKSDFLARMSHEIRTPMNAIMGMADISKRKLSEAGTASPDVLQHMRQIELSSMHLLGLINDILDISKIEAGKIELLMEGFDLRQTAEEVASLIRHRCEDKNISFDILIEGLEHQHFISDPLRLRQVLINLLGNAVKFTPANGSILFRIQLLERAGGQSLIEFCVKDNGIGISEDRVERLFKPFEQADAQISREYGGTGLGLSISRSIVQMLGSDISLSSKPGEGSEFSFSLWLKEDDSRICDSGDAAENSYLPGKRVLLVDDVSINRVIVMEQLAHTGLCIEEAEDGRAALDKFAASEEGYYDIILMDVQMPRMDGYAAAAAIRALERPDAASVPIIAMTANAFKEDVERALQQGMNAHLAKPLELGKVIAVLNKYLAKQ